MLIVIGLVILIAALVVGVAGVLSNHGAGHALGHQFTVLGQHIQGSSGKLFLFGIVVGAIALAGLLLVLAGARRTARRARLARQELKQARQETAAVAADRDQLAQAHARMAPVPNPTTGAPAHSEAPADTRNHQFFGQPSAQ